jgi:hypothetical protein
MYGVHICVAHIGEICVSYVCVSYVSGPGKLICPGAGDHWEDHPPPFTGATPYPENAVPLVAVDCDDGEGNDLRLGWSVGKFSQVFQRLKGNGNCLRWEAGRGNKPDLLWREV